MSAGTVGEGAAAGDVPDPELLSGEALLALAGADLTALDVGSFLVLHHTGGGVAEAAVLQVRTHGLEQIGARAVGALGTDEDVMAWLAGSVAALAELEDSDGLSSTWISTVVLTGERATSPELHELVRRSHPDVPILRPAPPDPTARRPTSLRSGAASVVIPNPVSSDGGATTPRTVHAALVPAMTPTLADRFEALNPDWDLGDDDPRPDQERLHGARRHERAIVAAAALVLTVAVAGVASDRDGADGGGASSASAAPATAAAPPAPTSRITPVPEDVPEAGENGDVEIAVPAGGGSTGDDTWVIDFPASPDQRTRTYTVTYVFDSMLTESDVPEHWNERIAVPASDLDRMCNGVSSPPVLTTIDREFASPSGDERVWSGVRIFENSVTAQAALRTTERALGRCDLVLHVDDDSQVIRSEIVHLDQALIPDVGDSSFAVATRTSAVRDAAVALYGLVRWRRCLAVVEYSIEIGRTPTGWPPAIGSSRHERFDDLLRAASRRMERSQGDCPSVTPTQ